VDVVRLCKRLSYVLRHRPDSVGLSLDDAGWVEVEALLSARSPGGPRRGLIAAALLADRAVFPAMPCLRLTRTDKLRSVLTREEIQGLVLVVLPVFVIGVYGIVRGGFSGDSVDPVPVVLGIGCVVCVGGMLHRWWTSRPRN
jgi:hypothetical protein